MPALDSDDVRSALKTKLRCKEVPSSHYRYILYDEDQKTILATTIVSHGPKHQIGDGLLSKMARQMNLGTVANFVGMVRCPKTREECLAIIKSLSAQKRP